MKLEVERSGGFAGRTVRWSLDLDGLDPDQRAEVQQLLTQAGDWAGSPAPDRFSYRLLTQPDTAVDTAVDSLATDPPAAPGLDVRFAEPLPEPARRLLEVVRAAQP